MRNNNKRHNIIILTLSTLVHIITTTETILDNTQTNDPKIKIQKLKYQGLSTIFIYSYIIREVRETEREIRNKKERENK
jgi:hypothetical protein